MTKVSLRHLNEIVRERNQYSRDAQEAWQDFINLKGRMDTEIQKVTKRNNFLVEELENWKQQFEKFQAFAAQLTKEASELKSKIETHKKENRRLGTLLEQQKDDTARLMARLAGTEKERDEALQALAMQQEVAEELERERLKNKREIQALEKKTIEVKTQREQAQRVVLHLRSLIEGQAHHMEHIVKSLAEVPDLSAYVDEEEVIETEESERYRAKRASPAHSRATSRASTVQGSPLDGENAADDMENRFHRNNSSRNSMRRYSQMSVADVADRHLRDKTDAIAHIIRNISAQCAAAVEGLQKAHDAARDAEEKRMSVSTTSGSIHEDDEDAHTSQETDSRRGSYLSPRDAVNSMPPTPDLIHRSSTALSFASTPDRQSFNLDKDVDVPTRIVEDEDGEAMISAHEEAAHMEEAPISKGVEGGVVNRSGARLSAFGSA